MKHNNVIVYDAFMQNQEKSSLFDDSLHDAWMMP
jgi:hypothetical protein